MRSPSFPFYVRDWLSSETVLTLHYENPRAATCYLFLLCQSWLSEPPATLPKDHAKLARFGKVSEEEFEKIWDLIAHEFEERDGRLFNPKLLQLYERQQVAVRNGSMPKQKRKQNRSKLLTV